MHSSFARPYACEKCHDIRMTARYPTARDKDLVPCDRCGLLTEEEYQRLRRDAWIKDNKPPEICELDLSAKELEWLRRMKVEHPQTSKLTILSWIEGQRYDPSKDTEFLAAARDKFKEWRARA